MCRPLSSAAPDHYWKNSASAGSQYALEVVACKARTGGEALRARQPRAGSRNQYGESIRVKRKIETITDRDVLTPGSADGAIAQLGERLNGIQEVRGSTPLGSTKSLIAEITWIDRLAVNVVVGLVR